MAVPANVDEFLDLVRKSGVADEKRLDAFLQEPRAGLPEELAKVADLLIQAGILTNFQAENILLGKWKRFSLGKYKILERLGSGGFAQVYLCEHKLMRRRVAVKVLPVAKTKGSSALERFYREARAVAALDHANIVHAFDIDQDGDLHFIVMEYVDGANLQEIVKTSGPLSVPRACHYIAHAAFALQHAHEHGMVHRDVKPGNFLVDRAGVVKLLDLGLALVFDKREKQLTKIHDDGTLGSADYLSPEQAMDSHDVDIRTDIYSLGVTFYFLLTGRPPFDGLPVADKLLAHQMKQPPPITEYRQDVPADILAIISKMMSKSTNGRYATPGDVADALAPFTQTPIAPPTDAEMPVLSPAASGNAAGTKAAAAQTGPGSGAGKNEPAVADAPPVAPPSTAKNEPVDTAESVPWEQASTDTDNQFADDDPPFVPARASAKEKLSPKASRKNLLVIVILVMGFIVIPVFMAIAIGLALWLFPSSELDKTPDNTPLKIEVSKDPNRKNAQRSIQAALRNAKIGSVIELWDETYDETVVLDGNNVGARTSITLQAAPGKEEIVWRSGGRNDPETPILRIIKAPEFKLKGKGIIFDGALDKDLSINDLLMITSDCSGMVIEDLQFRRFTRNAILVMNAAGAADRPIRLRGLWTFTQVFEKPRAGIYFDANPAVTPFKNDHIEIRDCTFNGLEPANAIGFNKKLEVLGDNVRWPGK